MRATHSFSDQLCRRFRSPSLILLTAGIAFGLTACQTPRGSEQTRKEILWDVHHGDYLRARDGVNELYGSRKANEPAKVDDKPQKDAKQREKHSLIWNMQRASIDGMEGDYDEAIVHLNQAADLVEEFRQKAVSNIIASATINETAKSYDGKAYEHIYIDYLRSLLHVVLAQREDGVLQGEPHIYAKGVPLVDELQGDADIDQPALGTAPGDKDKMNNAFEGLSVADHYDRAISYARRMVFDQLKATKDTAEATWMTEYRYYDDPFARLLTAAIVWSLPNPRDDDFQLANAMLKRARTIYKEQHAALSKDEHMFYETADKIRVANTLSHRTLLRYDPQGYRDYLGKVGKTLEDPDIMRMHLKEGYGSVLVLNHSGVISRPRTLDVRVRTGLSKFIGFGGVSQAEKNEGIGVTTVTVGNFQVSAKGPGVNIVNTWIFPTFPHSLEADMRETGKVMGFALPVHPEDHKLDVHNALVINNEMRHDFEVVSDLDAYARATLKDEQPRLLLKTLTRAVAKQVAADAAGEAAKKAAQEQGNDNAAAIGQIVGSLSSAAMTSTEVADLRSWFLMPDHIQAVMVDLPVGEHSLTIETPFGGFDAGRVSVPEGRLVILPVKTMPDLPFNPYQKK